MTPGTTPVAPTLAEAITAVESTDADYRTAVNQTTTDQADADAIQVKLDAAKSKVTIDTTNQTAAAVTRNTALDALIAAATAAKIPVPSGS